MMFAMNDYHINVFLVANCNLVTVMITCDDNWLPFMMKLFITSQVAS